MTKSKSTLYYVGLESLESRYTLQLTEWNKRVFTSMGVKHVVVPGVEIDKSKEIKVGQVLDAHGRPFYALSQMQWLVQALRDGKITKEDTIFFEDMFHPGFEALPYIFNQQGWRPKVFVRCLAQTVDPDDFVHVAKMTEWMRRFEQMVNATVDAVLIASHEMAGYATAAGWTVPLIVTGLPFGKDEVRERVGYKPPSSVTARSNRWKKRALRVVFAARTDQEKQPQFFLTLAQTWKTMYGVDVEFAILSGKTLTANAASDLRHIREAQERGYINVYENLSKDDYYHLLTDSRVLFNCALQDWVSNTVSEADALGCNVLYPAYRSFVEVFMSDHSRLYVPWSLPDALTKLRRLLLYAHPNMGEISDHQDDTIYRTVRAMQTWQKGVPLAKQNLPPNIPVIDPRDTTYRPLLSMLDWEVSGIGHDFWNYGKVTDQQLSNSLKTK